MSIDNSTGNSFTFTQNYNETNDTLVEFNKLYGHTMYIGQMGTFQLLGMETV